MQSFKDLKITDYPSLSSYIHAELTGMLSAKVVVVSVKYMDVSVTYTRTDVQAGRVAWRNTFARRLVQIIRAMMVDISFSVYHPELEIEVKEG